MCRNASHTECLGPSELLYSGFQQVLIGPEFGVFINHVLKLDIVAEKFMKKF